MPKDSLYTDIPDETEELRQICRGMDKRIQMLENQLQGQDKTIAMQIIGDLESKINGLEHQLRAVTITRDKYMEDLIKAKRKIKYLESHQTISRFNG